MSSTKKLHVFLFSLAAIIATTTIVLASSTDTISGWAWSGNTGWIKLNNCTDPNTPSTCDTNAYGLTAPLTGSGIITGYVWSSNIGWINFADNSCPTSGCTPGAKINWTTGKITGWARACSVYASGCSGTLANTNYLGGWDGYINLGPGSNWGLSVATSGAISGYAWGSDVIGWTEFNGAVNLACPTGQTRVNGLCTQTPSCAGGTINTTTNTCSCPRGTTLTNGACDGIITPTDCVGGTIANNMCSCPTGTGLILGVCTTITPVNPTSCPTGQHISNNTCVCSDGSTPPNTGPTAGQCPKKHPSYIES